MCCPSSVALVIHWYSSGLRSCFRLLSDVVDMWSHKDTLENHKCFIRCKVWAKRWTNVVLILAHRLRRGPTVIHNGAIISHWVCNPAIRRWPNIKPAFFQRLVYVGKQRAQHLLLHAPSKQCGHSIWGHRLWHMPNIKTTLCPRLIFAEPLMKIGETFQSKQDKFKKNQENKLISTLYCRYCNGFDPFFSRHNIHKLPVLLLLFSFLLFLFLLMRILDIDNNRRIWY